MASEPLAALVAAKALDGLSMRMAAIAQTIANANSPQFQPVRVPFEAALRAAASRGPEAVRGLEFVFEADRSYGPGEDRRLDLALADASATAGRYEALADLLGRRLALQHALAGGQ
jgi:flagellar basal-body rod protein FlgB